MKGEWPGRPLNTVLTSKNQLRLRHHALDVHRRLLHFRRNKHASREDEIRIRLADRVLEVEPPKEDRGCGNGYLAEEQPFAQFLNQVGEPDSETVMLSRSAVAEVGGTRSGETGAGVEMVSRVRGVPEVGGHGGAGAADGGWWKREESERKEEGGSVGIDDAHPVIESASVASRPESSVGLTR
jgi:hypothetical protein